VAKAAPPYSFENASPEALVSPRPNFAPCSLNGFAFTKGP